MTWTTEQPPQIIWQGPENIKNPASAKPEYCEKIDPLHPWSVFVNENMIQMIVTWTNQSIKQSLSKCKQSASDKNVAHLSETMKEKWKPSSGYGTYVDCWIGITMI